jgi:hypothetical protein
MTMIDETLLSEALHADANNFEISPEAINRIVGVARGADMRDRRQMVPKFLRQRSSGRTSLIAASLILVVGATSLPLMRDGGGGATNLSARSPASIQSIQGTAALPSGLSNVQGNHSSSLAPATGISGVATTSQSLKIESHGTVQLTVPDGRVQASLTRLSALALNEGGFVDSTEAVASAQKSANYSNGTIVLQVPQRLFATLVTQVQRIGSSTSVNVQSSDVTSQYIGLQARITALDVSRQQYLSIMARASTIGDILAVQTQLNSLQSQIEQLQGQMNLLNNEVTYGSLTVQLTEASHAPSKSLPSGIAKAFHQSVAGFVAGFEWLIRIGGPALFVVLVLGALFGVTKFIRRSIRRRRI